MFMTRWQQPVAPTWASIGRLLTLRDELDRLFESPFDELAGASRSLPGWTPLMDLYEDKDRFVVKAELPGMKKEAIEISLHEGALTVSGERQREEKHEQAGVYREEREFGKFRRSILLPKAVAADKVTATYQDGILTVALPKTEEVKPKQIEVKVK